MSEHDDTKHADRLAAAQQYADDAQRAGALTMSDNLIEIDADTADALLREHITGLTTATGDQTQEALRQVGFPELADTLHEAHAALADVEQQLGAIVAKANDEDDAE